MMSAPRVTSLLFGTLFVLSTAFATASTELASRVERLARSGTLEAQGARIATAALVADFYSQRGYTSAFDEHSIREILDGIEGMRLHGLDPDDYHRHLLRSLHERSRSLSAGEQADFELLLMDALLRLAYHLAYGKVSPATLDPDWNFTRPLLTADPLGELARAMDSGSPVSYLNNFLPEPDFYRDLKGALARYRRIAADGGWPVVASGPAIKPGMTDPRIPSIRARLRATGDLAGSGSADSSLYDQALRRAVEAFQQRQGLEPDGVIGPSTRAAMNVPVSSRIDQIRINLERARWVQRNLPPDFVLVNIAGFRVYLLRGGEVTWSSRVQVGKAYRETPVFRDEIEYVVFNPTWTVPPGILRKDIIPKARKSPDIIRRKGLKVLDHQGGEVDPLTVDWSAGSFPYVLRQDPGPDNALGRVKLMFPNEHLVYLHDTPSKELFERAQRTTSSGCIRVEDPLELTERVLSGTSGWDRARIDKVIDSKRTTRVDLERPLPVLILYWTAQVMDDGFVAFSEDVYDRDAPLLRALDLKLASASPGQPKHDTPASATAANGPSWVVQVASLANPDGARRLVDELTTKGFGAFITPSQVGGKDYHRVRLGPVTTRGDAEALADSLQMKAGYEGQVLRH